jgi:transposase-like protein
MLIPGTEREIISFLREKHSLTKIASLMKVSRNTLYRILNKQPVSTHTRYLMIQFYCWYVYSQQSNSSFH